MNNEIKFIVLKLFNGDIFILVMIIIKDSKSKLMICSRYL